MFCLGLVTFEKITKASETPHLHVGCWHQHNMLWMHNSLHCIIC